MLWITGLCHILWPELSCFVVPECFLWHSNARPVYMDPVTITGWPGEKMYTRFTAA